MTNLTQTLDNNDLLRQISELKEKYKEQTLRLEHCLKEKEELQKLYDELNEFKYDVENYKLFTTLLERARDEVNNDDYIDGVYCRQYINLTNIPLDPSTWCTLSRRAASYYRLTKGRSPERRGCHNIYRGKDVAFIVATINLIMRGL